MCGIAGILDSNATGNPGEIARAMASRLAHRGPDGEDVWSDPAAGVALGHRRLAIIDLSEAGHQPMVSSCGRMVLSYDGEVYNAGELRDELVARVLGNHPLIRTSLIISLVTKPRTVIVASRTMNRWLVSCGASFRRASTLCVARTRTLSDESFKPMPSLFMDSGFARMISDRIAVDSTTHGSIRNQSSGTR